jgi:hypothetical protein
MSNRLNNFLGGKRRHANNNSLRGFQIYKIKNKTRHTRRIQERNTRARGLFVLRIKCSYSFLLLFRDDAIHFKKSRPLSAHKNAASTRECNANNIFAQPAIVRNINQRGDKFAE